MQQINGACYKLKTLELIKRKNLVLGLTQENLIENSVQDSLSYILNPHSLCQLLLSYSKQPCVSLKVHICCTCSISLFFQNCCGNHQSQRPMTTQRVNLLSGYNVGSSQIKPALISMLYPHVHLISYSKPPCCLYMPRYHLPDSSIIFQAYNITSCDMSCDFCVMCLFIIQKKKKRKTKSI